MVFGEDHLQYILSEYETFHNENRPHQGVGNVPLTAAPVGPISESVKCQERLGGLLNHYYRKAG